MKKYTSVDQWIRKVWNHDLERTLEQQRPLPNLPALCPNPKQCGQAVWLECPSQRAL